MARPFRILCIDGGGIRGIIPAMWLARIEAVLKKRNLTLAKSFDLVCGTSTGSILAAAVASEIPMASVIELFEQRGPAIFRMSRHKRLMGKILPLQSLITSKYSHEPLKEALQSVLSNRRLSEARTRLCIPAYDIGHRRAFYFRSYDELISRNEMWQACLSSSSAPTYFPVNKAKLADGSIRYLVDGGVAANNPCGVGLAEGISLLNKRSLVQTEEVRPIQLVSLGTGSSTRNLTKMLNGNRGLLSWASSMIDVMFDGSADVSAYMAEQILAPDAYVRLQFSLNQGQGNDDLDNAHPANIEELRAAAEDHLDKAGKKAFSEILSMLVPPQAPIRQRGAKIIPITPGTARPESSNG